MEFVLDTPALLRELFKVKAVASGKSTLPILQHTLIEALEDGTVTFAATDNELTLISSATANVVTPGRIAVRASDFFDMVKSASAPTVRISKSSDGGWVNLDAGAIKARFASADPLEYPALVRMPEKPSIVIPTAQFTRVMDRAIISVSTDDGRPNLTGALTKLSTDGTFTMVATDGHRLSHVSTKIANFEGDPGALSTGVIIPKRGLAELRRTIDSTEPELGIEVSGSNVIFGYGATQLSIRLIDASFPDFKRVIPAEKPERRAEVSRTELLQYARIANMKVGSGNEKKMVRLELDPQNNALIISSNTKDCEFSATVDAVYSGKSVKAGYNPSYFTELLPVLPGDKLFVEMIDALSPTIIRETEGEDGDDSLFIVMPMRL